MSLMTRFQQKKKADPGFGTNGGFQVVGTMPGSSIGKQQALSKLEKELEGDLAALKMVRSIKQKESEKAEHLVPKYMPLVNSLRGSDSNHFLLGQILVWLFDIKDIPQAMDLAVYCIAHDVPMPERFKRDLSTFLCDTIIEWAENEHEAGRSCEPYFGQVFDLAKDWDIPDQVRARFYRLRGLIALKKKEWKQAVIELEYASEYGAKVKTWLARANKKNQEQTDM
jgi:hypothetical protein